MSVPWAPSRTRTRPGKPDEANGACVPDGDDGVWGRGCGVSFIVVVLCVRFLIIVLELAVDLAAVLLLLQRLAFEK